MDRIAKENLNAVIDSINSGQVLKPLIVVLNHYYEVVEQEVHFMCPSNQHLAASPKAVVKEKKKIDTHLNKRRKFSHIR